MDDAATIPGFQPVCTAMLREGLTIRFRAPGTSMLPTIHDGDTLVVQAVDAPSVRRGDVVVVAGASCVHAHRVVGLPENDAGFFVLRGDSLAAYDAPVPSEGILGRVVRAERGGRSLGVDGFAVRSRVFLFRLGRFCRCVLAGAITAADRSTATRLRSAVARMSKCGLHNGPDNPPLGGLETSPEV